MRLQLIRRLLLVLVSTVVAARTTASDALPFPAAETDIWVLAGQSNMQGYGLIKREYKANPRVMVYDLQNKWVPAVPPTHRIYSAEAPAFKKTIFELNPTLTAEGWEQLAVNDSKRPLGGVGPDISFAESIVKTTGRHVVLLPCALGGTTLAQWSPERKNEGDASLYGAMLGRIARLGGRVKGILWYQGEGQTGSAKTAESFEQDFLALVDSVRRDLGDSDLPFLYVQIGRFCVGAKESEPRWKAVQEKQRVAAAQRKNLWVVPAVDLELDDLIHVGEEGQRRLGHRLAEVALTHVYRLPGFAHPIDFAGLEILAAADALHHCLRVRFSGVTGGLRGAGRISGFALESDEPSHDGPMVYKVEVDPENPNAVLVWYSKPITQPVRLSYALGFDVYANLTDARDMAVPAFGPVKVEPRK